MQPDGGQRDDALTRGVAFDKHFKNSVPDARRQHSAMSWKWACAAALVLLGLAAERAARPTGTLLTEGAPNLNNEYIVSSCPHTIRRIASPQQISGVWYMWQLLRHANDSGAEHCIRFTFGSEGNRLTLTIDYIDAGLTNTSRNFTYTQSPTTLWEGVGPTVTSGFQMGFASDDESLLLLCSLSIVRRHFDPWDEIDLSMLFGREPTLDEAAISAAVNQTALEAARRLHEVVSIRPPLQECSRPAATAR